VTRQLKAGIIRQEEAAIFMQQGSNKHTTIEELLEAMFSMQFMLSLHREDQLKIGDQNQHLGVF
jgi:hypothetical protein